MSYSVGNKAVKAKPLPTKAVLTKFKVTWSTGGIEVFETKDFKTAAVYVQRSMDCWFHQFKSLEVVI